jgi:uncharacterized membrane protein (Fun14 family)
MKGGGCMQYTEEMIATNAFGGFLIGLVVGYALKKIASFAFFVTGLGVLFVLFAEYAEVVRIEDQALMRLFDHLSVVLQEVWQIVYARVSDLGQSGGIGLAAGFLTGIKK